MSEAVAAVLRSRGVRVEQPSPEGAHPHSAEVLITVRETVCAWGGPSARPSAGGERTSYNEDGFVYPGRPIPPVTTVPGHDFSLEAVVQVTESSTGRDLGRLDLRLDPVAAGAVGDGNFPGRVRSARSMAFSRARQEVERFVTGWEERLRFAGEQSVDCGSDPEDSPAEPDLARAFAVVGSCRGLVAARTDGRLASALYNLGLSALRSGVASLAQTSFEEASALDRQDARYALAVEKVRRIRRLGGRIASE